MGGFQFMESWEGAEMTICRLAAMVTLAFICSSAKSQSIASLMGVPENHCSVAQGTVDGKTFVCEVWDGDPQKFSNSLQLEIYRNQQLVTTIKTGDPIREWHFWKNGEQLSIHAARQGEVGTYRLYETTGGKQVDQAKSVSIRTICPNGPRIVQNWMTNRCQKAQHILSSEPCGLQNFLSRSSRSIQV
jgi:hypothetical protein